MADNENVVWEAEFNPKVKSYWLLSGLLVCVCTIVLIPVAPIWFIVGQWICGKYLASHRCTLTEKTLKVSRGIFVRQEKTVPLDRITDLGLVQGPIMRALDIESISVETAGQSGPGSLISLTGIRDGRKFRDAVLQQRDAAVAMEVRSQDANASSEAPVSASSDTLTEIRDILRRMEASTCRRD